MSKSFEFPNVGTCSKLTKIVLNDDHTIESIEVVGGCNGNLKGISRLLKGMKAEDAIERMEGTTCGPRPTSCVFLRPNCMFCAVRPFLLIFSGPMGLYFC